jgi:hypothetical protein
VVYVRAEIYVESTSQKKIVIGKQGGLIKRIGTDSRAALENASPRNCSSTCTSRSSRLAQFPRSSTRSSIETKDPVCSLITAFPVAIYP